MAAAPGGANRNAALGFGSSASQQVFIGSGASANQQLGTAAGSAGAEGCRLLVSTQVAGAVNLALGRGSQAGQSISAQGPRGVLATTSFTRGANLSVGAGSVASQRLQNWTER